MEVQNPDLALQLSEKGLKVTPQRMIILEAIHRLNNHPTADNIITEIRRKNPNIGIGTVYHVLDTLVKHRIISKVKTDSDVMRYDGIRENHHHLYCSTCDLIEDYHDEELDQMLMDYFRTKKLSGFEIEEFVLQIKGKFDKC
jgi:Fur family peroxide stress response transcriptional regulator